MHSTDNFDSTCRLSRVRINSVQENGNSYKHVVYELSDVMTGAFLNLYLMINRYQ